MWWLGFPWGPWIPWPTWGGVEGPHHPSIIYPKFPEEPELITEAYELTMLEPLYGSRGGREHDREGRKQLMTAATVEKSECN